MFEIIISFILGILAISTGYYVYTSIKIRKSYIFMRKRFEGLKQHNNERYAEMTEYAIHTKQWCRDLEKMIKELDIKSIKDLNQDILGEKKQVNQLIEMLKRENERINGLNNRLDILNGKVNALKEDPKFLNRY